MKKLILCTSLMIAVSGCTKSTPDQSTSKEESQIQSNREGSLIPRSTSENAEYYLISVKADQDTIKTLHSRISPQSIGYSLTRIDCTSKRYQDLGYGENSKTQIKMYDNPQWTDAISGSSKSDLIEFACTESTKTKERKENNNNFGLNFNEFLENYNAVIDKADQQINLDNYRIDSYEKTDLKNGSVFKVHLKNGVIIDAITDQSQMIYSLGISYSPLKDDFFSAFEFTRSYVDAAISKEKVSNKGDVNDLLNNLDKDSKAREKAFNKAGKHEYQIGNKNFAYELKGNTLIYTITPL